MASKEEISMIGFEIVAYAGDAQTDLIAACEKASQGDIDGARALHESAKQALIDAHDVQTRLLSQEAGGGEMEVTFIMVHAQDTLMTTMLLEKQTKFTIDAYQRIAQLEASLFIYMRSATVPRSTSSPGKRTASTFDSLDSWEKK